MRASQHWERGVKAKQVGTTNNIPKRKKSRVNKKEDICLNCKEKKCEKGTCKEFKK